jgi:tetratricopeptide (TPR) repeat protein
MRIPIVSAAVLLLTLSSCSGPGPRERGQRALAAGRHERAVALLRQAMAEEDDLRKDPEFRQSLRRAYRGAAATRYRKALEAADAGRLDEARTHLARALQYEPDHNRARRAMAWIEDRSPPPDVEARRFYREATRHIDAHRWAEALAAFDAALTRAEGHVPARVARHDVRATIRRVNGLVDEARQLAGQKKIDRAEEVLGDALGIWPDSGEARELLERVARSQRHADDLFARARVLADRGQFDEAIASAADALAIAPFRKAPGRFIDEVKRRAAEATVAEARRAAEAGRLREAIGDYRAALRYAPTHDDARRELATTHVHLARRLLEQADRPGAALLQLHAAADIRTTDEIEVLIDRARRESIAPYATAVAVAEAGPVSANLLKALRTSLSARATSFVRHVPADAEAAWRVRLAGNEPRLRAEPVSTDTRTHRYTIHEEVPNPEVDDLLEDLDDTLEEIERLHHTNCVHCHGRGRLACPTCSGAGHLRCTQCGGQGRILVGGAWRPCGHCGGRGTIGCNYCGRGGALDRGWVTCSHCAGRGRGVAADDYRLRTRRRRLDRIRARLHAEPRTVMRPVPARVAYTVTTWRKIASVSGDLKLSSPAGEAVVNRAIDTTAHADDTTIENPRPDIGLRPDPLTLPEDAVLRARAVDRLARQAAKGAMEAIAESIARAIAEEMAKARQTDSAEDLLETRVAAALLESTTNPARGEQMLRALMGTGR